MDGLGEVDDAEQRDERAALDGIGDAVDPRRKEAPSGLRQDHIGHALRERQADGLGRFHLAVVDGLERAARRLDRLRRLEHGQRHGRRGEVRQVDPDDGQSIEHEEDQDENGDPADRIAEQAHGKRQRRRPIRNGRPEKAAEHERKQYDDGR